MADHRSIPGVYVVVLRHIFCGMPMWAVRIESVGEGGEFSGAWNEGMYDDDKLSMAVEFGERKAREYGGRLFVEKELNPPPKGDVQSL